MLLLCISVNPDVLLAGSMTFGPVNTEAPFVEENVFFPPDFEQFLLKVTDFSRSVAQSVNQREICAYVSQEILTGSTLFSVIDSRAILPVYRKVIDFGPLPNATTTSIPHGLAITDTWRFIKILVGATNPLATGATEYSITVPDANSTVGVTLTDVVITTSADYSAFTSTTVILEYVKNIS